MRKATICVLGVLVALSCAAVASANKYPPGPGNAYPDTLTIENFQREVSPLTPKPVPTDTVYGIGGIVTGTDFVGSTGGFYFQISTGAMYTGIDVFMGSTFPTGMQRGDSVIVYGKLQDFGGGTEIEGYDASNNTNDLFYRTVSTGNPVPPYHIGTVAELKEKPKGATSVMEQWEGMLVKVRGPLRVVRSSLQHNTLGTLNSFLAVDTVACPSGSGGPCDSLFIDGNTMSTPTQIPPAIGALIDSVQGIYEERTRGYRIQLRSTSDMFAALPPNLDRAYSIEDDKIRVMFDKAITQTTAEDIGNYTLTQGQIDLATQVAPSVVELTISSPPAEGFLNELKVINVCADAGCALKMTVEQSSKFYEGVMRVHDLQVPSPAGLAEATCEDRSRFTGTPPTASGERMTVRGTCTGVFGGEYYIQDETTDGTYRNGIHIHGGPVLERGKKYRVVSKVSEFFGESEIAAASAAGGFNTEEEGIGTIPAPILQTISLLRDNTCDAAQNILNGEDFEGMLVRVENVRVLANAPQGGYFRVYDPNTYPPVDIEVSNGAVYTYTPTAHDILNVTGVLRWDFGEFRIFPRDDADIEFVSSLGVPPGVPNKVTFSVYPNPARSAKIAFGLPKASDVELAVFDVAGRKVASLFRGRLDAGNHSSEWNGRTTDGSVAGAGLYFYRLKVNNEVFRVRGVKLN